MYREFYVKAIRAAIEAGEAIMEIYNSPETDWQVERKSDNSPLTLADRRAHAVIVRHLAPTGIPVLSEEGAHAPYDTRRDWTRLWVVDPLDGTKEFIKRNGEFTVNIALVEHGTPVFGVIFVPVSRTLYYGSSEAYKAENLAADAVARLEGSYAEVATCLNACRLLCAREAGEGGAYVVVASRSHLSPETQDYIDALRARYPQVQTVSAGSSLKLCLVAEGRADVYPRFAPTMEWDTAAGHAIVKAAGGTVLQANTTQPLIYNKEDLHNPWFIVHPQAGA